MIKLTAKTHSDISRSHFDLETCGAYSYFVFPHGYDLLLPMSARSNPIFIAAGYQECVELIVVTTEGYGVFDIYRSCQNPGGEMRDLDNHRYLTTIIGTRWLDLNQIVPGGTPTTIFLRADQ
jgi:hypothetical protein